MYHCVGIKKNLLCYRYGDALDKGRRLAMKKYYVLSAGLSFYYLILYASYALAFWYGTRLIEDGYTTPGGVFTVYNYNMVNHFK